MPLNYIHKQRKEACMKRYNVNDMVFFVCDVLVGIIDLLGLRVRDIIIMKYC